MLVDNSGNDAVSLGSQFVAIITGCAESVEGISGFAKIVDFEASICLREVVS